MVSRFRDCEADINKFIDSPANAFPFPYPYTGILIALLVANAMAVAVALANPTTLTDGIVIPAEELLESHGHKNKEENKSTTI
ncbi:hypothetical protein TcWFU_006010 [Taenia crassiceps]|uniref:Uncharacterized protein n=1 Tax=Taenia crassiceps TaxID=6207 RepID=A0ABR4Q3C5_9CEST